MVIVIGLGEMGSLFARAFLRTGRTVRPILRTDDLITEAQAGPGPEIVVVAVGEADLPPLLEKLSTTSWSHRLLLLQNELLPRDWEKAGIENPTVISVWFEKKKGQDTKVIIPSPVHGPAASDVVAALGTLGIDAVIVDDRTTMEDELISKNLYILTANIAGLDVGGTVQELWQDHRALAEAVGGEILDIQEHLVGREIDRSAATARMVAAFEGDPDHSTTGRSAPARLRRALHHADQAQLEVPTLRGLARRHIAAS